MMRSLPFLLCLLPCLVGSLSAHTVPSTEIEARFEKDGRGVLTINLDPRAFLAADPTQLPPVPGSWYHEQSAEQQAATRDQGRLYLEKALTLLLDGQKITPSRIDVQPIDGADNNPLRQDTAELHFLATFTLQAPPKATTFQLDYAKSAKTDAILLQTGPLSSDRRFQVIFPGETSRPFRFRDAQARVEAPMVPPKPDHGIALGYIIGIVVILVITGGLLLNKYRHYHRAHRKPRE